MQKGFDVITGEIVKPFSHIQLRQCQILNLMLHCNKIKVDLDDIALAIFYLIYSPGVPNWKIVYTFEHIRMGPWVTMVRETAAADSKTLA